MRCVRFRRDRTFGNSGSRRLGSRNRATRHNEDDEAGEANAARWRLHGFASGCADANATDVAADDLIERSVASTLLT